MGVARRLTKTALPQYVIASLLRPIHQTNGFMLIRLTTL
jgi:hypothetical protein